jgi:hypothetical protein
MSSMVSKFWADPAEHGFTMENTEIMEGGGKTGLCVLLHVHVLQVLYGKFCGPHSPLCGSVSAKTPNQKHQRELLAGGDLFQGSARAYPLKSASRPVHPPLSLREAGSGAAKDALFHPA